MKAKSLAVEYEEFRTKFEIHRNQLGDSNLGRFEPAYLNIGQMLRELIDGLESFDNEATG